MSDLAGAKTVYYGFTGAIDSGSVTRVCSAMNAAVNDGCDSVVVTFSSLGGYVADGIFLYNFLRGLPLRLTFYNLGSVASIAAAVFVAAEERYCSEHAMFMVHPTAFPPLEGMSAGRLEPMLQAALADDLRTENVLRERTFMPAEMLDARKLRDVHITPSEAVRVGLVQGIREFALPKGQRVFQI